MMTSKQPTQRGSQKLNVSPLPAVPHNIFIIPASRPLVIRDPATKQVINKGAISASLSQQTVKVALAHKVTTNGFHEKHGNDNVRQGNLDLTIPPATVQPHPHRTPSSSNTPTSANTPSEVRFSDFKVDVYAQSYVPQFLKNINTLPAHAIHSIPPPSTNFDAFVRSFAGSLFLDPLPKVAPVIPHKADSDIETMTVDASCYQAYFTKLLSAELFAAIEDYRRYELYNVPLLPQHTAPYLYKLSVPGIVEDNPPVQEGDMVALRQLRIDPRGPFSEKTVLFTGVANLVYVVGIHRAQGFVILKADNLVRESLRFNVVFGVSEVFGSHMRALQDAQVNLISSENSFMRRMLFPKESDGVMQTSLPKGRFNRKWFDEQLNYEQQKAVDAIANQDYGSVPYLISGPPGTGKTKTVCETALQIIHSPGGDSQHILLCAPSDQAADTIALRLSFYFTPTQLLRLQRNTRSFAEVPDKLMQYCHIDNSSHDMFGLPDWKSIMSYSIVVCSAKDSNMLVEARCTNRDIYKLQSEMWAAFAGGLTDQMAASIRLHWTGLLFDEAAQGTETETVLALTTIMPPASYSSTMPFFALAGDQKQLGPRLVSRISNLERSLLERLFDLSLYAHHPLSRRNLITGAGIDRRKVQPTLPYLRPPFTNLLRNYRSHPAILAVPSAIFYHDTLITEARDVHSLAQWNGWQGKKWPVMFVKNGGLDEWEDEGPSFFNLREVSKVRDLVLSLVNSGLIEPYEIAVMAPFREQVKLLRLRLRETRPDLRNVNVGPIEAFQGAEHRFVIICTTRTRERFLKQDIENGLGIIYENKRLTVALTRAKEGVVFIGNPWLLQKDPSWLAIISFCVRNGLVMDDNEPQAKSKSNTITKRNETAWLKNNKLQKNIDPPEVEDVTLPTTQDPNSVADVNLYTLPEFEQIAPQHVGRIEQALIYNEELQVRGDEMRGALYQDVFHSDAAMYLAAATAEKALELDKDFDMQDGL